jgi:putative ATP-binding cassette transporter
VLGGEEEERNAVDGSLTNVLRRWRQICFQTVRTTIISQTSGYIAPVLPVILCAPKFLNGTMTLGQVMQAASAFTIVQAAFNWLVDNYPRLADWTASARRVASLMVSLDALERAEKGEGVNRIERTEGTAASLRLSDLSVTLDTGKAVVKDAEVDIMPGESSVAENRAREEHAGARDFRPVAMGRRQCPGRQRREDVPHAATGLRSGRNIAPCRDLS